MLCLATLNPMKAAEEVLVYVHGQHAPLFNCWLTDKPIITFNENGLLIKSSTLETTLAVRYSEISNIEFKSSDSDILTDIEDAENQATASMRFRYVDGKIVVVEGLGNDAPVHLYSLDGKNAVLNVTKTADRITVHLEHLSKGIYLLHIDNQTFKIYKK